MDAKKKFEVPRRLLDLIQKRMANQGLSLRQVAQRANMSPSFLVRILQGERKLPADAALLRIAWALGIDPPERLLVEARPMPGNETLNILFRTASQLSPDEIEEVTQIAKSILLKERRVRKSGARKSAS